MSTPDSRTGDGRSPIERKQLTFAEREANFSWQVLRILAEFVDCFEFLSKVHRTVTLMGNDYWTPLTQWMKEQLLARRLIAPDDLDIWRCTDDIEEAVQVIRRAGERMDGGG